MKIYFVILHYQNIEVTIRCIECIYALQYIENCKAIVVDNASPNGSGEILRKKYIDDALVKVVINNANLGFAHGNNVGYKIAKEEGADIIIVQNNDVMVKQKNFLNILTQDRMWSKFYVIGPDIINKNGDHQNPFSEKPFSNRRINYFLLVNWLGTKIYKFKTIGEAYLRCKLFLKRHQKENKVYKNYENMKKNVALHGSCVIYTKKWIEKEDIAFLPITYMFMEEEILYEYAVEKQYDILYYPKLKVIHEEDASIDFSIKNEIEKKRFTNFYMFD